MNKQIKIKYYSDPGHGWFAVKRDLLINLGVERYVSQYSYTRGKTAYLEEDCDASLLFKALQDRGLRYEIVDYFTNKSSPIRSYDRYNPISTIQFSFVEI